MKKLLLMLAVLPLLASDAAPARFSGRIFDRDGTTRVAEAIVTVSTPSGYVSSVTTNKEGEFTFATLPSGEYDFRVTAHGYGIYERPLTVSGESGVRQLNVRLVVPANKQTVSVGELRGVEVSRSNPASTGATGRGY